MHSRCNHFVWWRLGVFQALQPLCTMFDDLEKGLSWERDDRSAAGGGGAVLRS